MFCVFRKLYVVLSVVLCLLASSLVAFFLFPRAVIVVDDGIHTVTVLFDHTNMKVHMNMTVGFFFSHHSFYSTQRGVCVCVTERTLTDTNGLTSFNWT